MIRDKGHSTDADADEAMRDSVAAAASKAEGNAKFKAKDFGAAIEQYTIALAHDPLDHIFYSNRSACYAEQYEGEKALRDAERCIALKPDFAKG